MSIKAKALRVAIQDIFKDKGISSAVGCIYHDDVVSPGIQNTILFSVGAYCSTTLCPIANVRNEYQLYIKEEI